jgi:hypothetical protein
LVSTKSIARCLRRFDLDEHATDIDTTETLAGVVRLLRQASVLAWATADRAGGGSSGQLIALGVDLAAGRSRRTTPPPSKAEVAAARGAVAIDRHFVSK